jgi:pimeloyl-ACP methyl ester carboxylesterase
MQMPMNKHSAASGLRKALTIGLFAAFGTISAQTVSIPVMDPLVASLGPGFSCGAVTVNGTSLHYVRGGAGPAIVFLHGFPEDWYEFHKVMPLLAKNFTVVAVDLRGVGDSAPATSGFDASNLAEDVHQLVLQLPLDHIYLVGHDIGGMVAYAYARRFPESARGVMILDVAFPGLDPWPDLLCNRFFWHIRFHQTDLPEKLVAGRQALYFRYFLDAEHFTDADVAHYAHSYRDPDHLSAAFNTYRAFPANEKFFAAQSNPLDLPIVIGSGEHDAFAPYLSRIADAMREHGCANLKTEIVKGSVHYVFDEQPEEVAQLIQKYALI